MGKALTHLAVNNAQPGPTRREISDGGAAGLYLVIQPTGSKSWAVRYRLQGKPQKITLGPVRELAKGERDPAEVPPVGEPHSLAQARRHAAELQDAIAAGALHQPAKAAAGAAEPDRDAFEAVARKFISRYCIAAQKPRSLRKTIDALGFRLSRDGAVLDREPSPKGGDGPAVVWRGRDLQAIRKRDVVELVAATFEARGGNAGAEALKAVRRLFNWAIEQDLLERSPCVGVKRPAPAVKRDRVLTDPELRLFWLGCDALGWPFGPLFKLLALTGCRLLEIGEAHWSECSDNRRVLELPGERTKNGKPHAVPLSPSAMELFKGLWAVRLAGDPDYVFTTGYGRIRGGEEPRLVPVKGYSKAKARLDAKMLEIARREAREAGLDPAKVKPAAPWTLHDLRRTAVTNMARLGIAVPVIERTVNHISGSFAGVAGVYNRASYESEMRDALERLAEGMSRIVRGEQLILPPNVETPQQTSRTEVTA